mmetsp:Transcript_14882/g.27527  ORF Transcript_14882/g.27527 Transcript_14882/m.27527 type:complete len:141 (+) Transcript_14882:39-461(+)
MLVSSRTPKSQGKVATQFNLGFGKNLFLMSTRSQAKFRPKPAVMSTVITRGDQPKSSTARTVFKCQAKPAPYKTNRSKKKDAPKTVSLAFAIAESCFPSVRRSHLKLRKGVEASPKASQPNAKGKRFPFKARKAHVAKAP